MFRVMMTLDGVALPSSCIYSGPRKAAEACAARCRRRPHDPRVGFVVLPCVA